MNKIKKVLITAMVGTLAFSTVGCKMIAKTPEAIQKTVIAKVGNEKITKGDLDKLVKPVLENYAKQYGADVENDPKLKEQVLALKKQGVEILVDEKILMQKAKELNLIPEQEELDQKIAEAMEKDKESYGGEEGFKQAIEASGLTEETYKERIETSIITEKVVNDMTKDVVVSDEDIKKYYDENPTAFTGADISHILISDEAKANEVRERVVNGEDFATVAKELSEDPGSKEQGGSLGFTMYNTTNLVPEFVAGMSKLKEGEISEPVKSQHGYHIIKATGVKITPFDEAKEGIKTNLEGQEKSKIYDETLKKWNEELGVKIYEGKL